MKLPLGDKTHVLPRVRAHVLLAALALVGPIACAGASGSDSVCVAPEVRDVTTITTSSAENGQRFDAVDDNHQLVFRLQCSEGPAVEVLTPVLSQSESFVTSSGQIAHWDLASTDVGEVPWMMRAVTDEMAVYIDLRDRPTDPEALLDEILSGHTSGEATP